MASQFTVRETDRRDRASRAPELLAGRRYRIAFPYTGDRFGGSNISSLLLAGALQERGHQPIIITHGDGRAADEARERGLTVRMMTPLNNVPGYSRPDRARISHLFAMPLAMATVRREGIEIIHTNDLSMLRTWAAPALFARRPLIAHWRTAAAPGTVLEIALRSAREIIAVSEFSKAQLPDWAQGRATVEYNPFEVGTSCREGRRDAADVRSELGLPPESILIGVFGTLIARKRAHVLADILREIRFSIDGRPVFGIACGSAAEPADALLYDKIERFGLASRLIVPGFVHPVERWMTACDVILAPAVKEAFGRTPLEAMAAGSPTIISSDCGCVELLENSRDAIILPPEPVEQWIAATRRLVDDAPLRRRFARAAAKKLESFSAAAHAARIERVYDHAMGSVLLPHVAIH